MITNPKLLKNLTLEVAKTLVHNSGVNPFIFMSSMFPKVSGGVSGGQLGAIGNYVHGSCHCWVLIT